MGAPHPAALSRSRAAPPIPQYPDSHLHLVARVAMDGQRLPPPDMREGCVPVEWAQALRALGPRALRCWIALLAVRDPKWGATTHISLPALAKRSGLSQHKVKRALDVLRRAGLLGPGALVHVPPHIAARKPAEVEEWPRLAQAYARSVWGWLAPVKESPGAVLLHVPKPVAEWCASNVAPQHGGARTGAGRPKGAQKSKRLDASGEAPENQVAPPVNPPAPGNQVALHSSTRIFSSLTGAPALAGLSSPKGRKDTANFVAAPRLRLKSKAPVADAPGELAPSIRAEIAKRGSRKGSKSEGDRDHELTGICPSCAARAMGIEFSASTKIAQGSSVEASKPPTPPLSPPAPAERASAPASAVPAAPSGKPARAVDRVRERKPEVAAQYPGMKLAEGSQFVARLEGKRGLALGGVPREPHPLSTGEWIPPTLALDEVGIARVPPPPRIREGATDAEVVAIMQLASRAAYEHFSGKRLWKPKPLSGPQQAQLLRAGRVLQAEGIAPHKWFRHSWQVWAKYKNGTEAAKGKTPTPGWLLAPARLASQAKWCKGALASFSGGAILWSPAVLELAARLDGARRAIRQTGEDSAQVRERMLPAQLEARLRARAREEAAANRRDIEARLMAGEWIW